MYAIMGITGRVASVVAARLLRKELGVRAIVRDPAKGESWRKAGAEVAVADWRDPSALARAFQSVDGVFLMTPPIFAPMRGFPETIEIVRALRAAVIAARPPKLVCLSSIGAQHDEGIGLIHSSRILERELGNDEVPRTFLRAAWFMDNHAWDVDSARRDGRIRSYLQPLARPVPMVATRDIGELAADLLLETWSGTRVVELEGPQRVSPLDVGAAIGRVLGREVSVDAVPRVRWADDFRAEGATWPDPRCEMIDGFNSGWIEFEGKPRRGRTGFDEVAAALVKKEGAS